MSLSLVAIFLAGCSNTPDDYAFWRDRTILDEIEMPTIPDSILMAEAVPSFNEVATRAEAITPPAAQGDNHQATAQESVIVDAAAIDRRQARRSLQEMQRRLLRDFGTSFAQTGQSTYVRPIPEASVIDSYDVYYEHDGDYHMVSADQVVDVETTLYVPKNVTINAGVLRPQVRQERQRRYVYGLSRSPRDYDEQLQRHFGYQPQQHRVRGGGIEEFANVNRHPAMRQKGVITEGTKTFFFDHGSASLSLADIGLLRRVALMVKDGTQPVYIAGHASSRVETNDPVEARLRNFQMSVRRTQEVMRILSRFGLPGHRLKPASFGDILPNTDLLASQDQESADRRVELYY